MLAVPGRIDRCVPLSYQFFPVHRNRLAWLPHPRYGVAMEQAEKPEPKPRRQMGPSAADEAAGSEGSRPIRKAGPCAKCKQNPKMKGAGYCRRCKSNWDTERRKFFREECLRLSKENAELRARLSNLEQAMAVSATPQ